jgi:RHS repeat-associated protein
MEWDGAWTKRDTVAPKKRFGYNGKEMVEEMDLKLLDYHARHLDPVTGRFLTVDPLGEKYSSLSPYAYVANNPLKYIDPDGRTIIPVHGTWSDIDTWKDLIGIIKVSAKLFNDNTLANSFPWSGANYASSRSEAARSLVAFARSEMKAENFDGQITLVGHSHGGNVSIEAINMMVELKEFNSVKINLLSINTPVRDDYQLTVKAAGRVNHVNVYDPKDPVQSNAGNSVTISPKDGNLYPNGKGWGEYGSSGRTFENARNIQVDNPQGVIKTMPMPSGMLPRIGIGDYHNSHNRVNEWINKKEDK